MARGKPSRRARPVRISYGLPKDTRGQQFHKCAVDFYHQFLWDWEEWDNLPTPKEINREELAAFFVQRGRMDPLPRIPTKAEWHLHISTLSGLRTRLNDAAQNSQALKNVIRWMYVVTPYIKGKLYLVKCCERIITSDLHLHRAHSYIDTQKQNVRKLFQGINHANHTEKELNIFNDRYEASEKCLDDNRRITERTIVSLEATRKKLK